MKAAEKNLHFDEQNIMYFVRVIFRIIAAAELD